MTHFCHLSLTADNITWKLTNQLIQTGLLNIYLTTTIHLTLMMTAAQVVETSLTTLLQTDDIAIALERMGHLAHKLTIYWIWKNNKPGTVWSGHCASLTWWWLWGCCCCCHWHKWICWRRWSYRWGRHWAFCWWWGWWTVCIPLQQCTAFFCQSISNTVPLWIH